MRGQEGTMARAWLLGDYAYNTNTATSITAARAFSASNVPTLPFTIPATHQGVTQLCGATGTITLPAASSIQDGYLTTIICTSSTATITVNTNSANVSLPGGIVNTTFTVSGMQQSVVLQWNYAASAWYSITGAPSFFGALLADNNLSDVANSATARGNLGAAALAGSPTQVFNVADARISTAAVAYGQFAASFGSSGEQTLPNGFILQWGVNSVGSPSTVYFPTTFPNACFCVIVSEQNASSGPWAAGHPTIHGVGAAPTVSSYVAWAEGYTGSGWTGGSITQAYIAIGH